MPTKQERLKFIEAEAAAIRAELEAEKKPKPLFFEDLEIMSMFRTERGDARQIKIGPRNTILLYPDGRFALNNHFPLEHYNLVVRQDEKGNDL